MRYDMIRCHKMLHISYVSDKCFLRHLIMTAIVIVILVNSICEYNI
jgi:hypothetical protein